MPRLLRFDGEERRGDAGRELELHVPRRLAAGRLHLDHVGAHVAEQHAAERAGHDLGHVDDADAVERARAVGRSGMASGSARWYHPVTRSERRTATSVSDYAAPTKSSSTATAPSSPSRSTVPRRATR